MVIAVVAIPQCVIFLIIFAAAKFIFPLTTPDMIASTVEGIGIAVEKGWQIGGKTLRDQGYQLESLAIVESMDPATGEIVFRH